MRSCTVIVQVIPCGRQYGLLRILLHYPQGQEEVERRRDHMLLFDNKAIEAWCGRHHASSMWGEV